MLLGVSAKTKLAEPRRFVASLLTVFAVGCGGADGTDETLMWELGALSASPEASDLVDMTPSPVMSTVAAETPISVWATPNCSDDYAVLDVANPGSGVEFSFGCTIVREVLTPDGQVKKRTVVYRTEEDTFLGGWIFGVYSPDGNIVEKDDGTLNFGLMNGCAGCHLARESDGFLFGIPR